MCEAWLHTSWKVWFWWAIIENARTFFACPTEAERRRRERGTNENANGLLRQFYPKKSRLDGITQEQLDKVVRLINNRPSKRLHYLTPYEVFKRNCVLE